MRLPVICIASMLAVVGCAQAPSQDVDWSLDKMTREGKFRVALVPPVPAPPVQQLHAWTIRLMTPAGAPIGNGLVYLNGGMPEHGHGMPTRPQTMGEVSTGVYRVEGVKFNMPGRWELIVAIQANGTEDFAYFNHWVEWPVAK